MSIRTIIERYPIIEVGYRHIYWRIPFLSRFAGKLLRRGTRSGHGNRVMNISILDEFYNELKKLGLSEGDTVIVHAGAHKFLQNGVAPREIIECLMKVVGPSGTIVAPAMPLLKDEPLPEKRFDDRFYAKPFEYHKGKERIWTGKLPRVLVEHEAARLSKIPLNSAAAIGYNAEHIIENQPMKDGMTPCGQDSLWARCFELDAKILMIDVDIAHSLTMIHVVEDLFENNWPIKDWYRDREFLIFDGTANPIHLKMRERHPKWALYYCEKRFNKDLLSNEIFVQTKTPNGLELSLGDSSRLVAFLRSKRPSTYPYYIPKFVGERRK